jgi:hypothetical protein
MGRDFIDVNVRLKKRFGFRIPQAALDEAIARRGDIRELTAGNVCKLVETHIETHGLRRKAVEASARSDSPVLEYAAPDGLGFDFRGDPWPAVRECIAAAL